MSKVLYDRLQARMDAELEQFRASLTEMDVQNLLAHATELAVKEQFVQRLESAFLSDDEIEVLLKLKQPLQFMYKNVWDRNHSRVISLFSDLAHAAGENARQECSTGDGAAHPANDRKYEITDIAHPQYPWLHRIRALRDVGLGGQVKTGDIGGFVQSEDNLSQQGECWLFNDAIACEGALVSQDAQVSGCAVIRGSSLVSGPSRVTGQAVVEDNAIVMDGFIEANARISGNARVGANQTTHQAPWIKQDAAVFGEVYGNVIVCEEAIVLPGAKIDLCTTDLLYIQTYRVEMARDVDRAKSNLKQPAGFTVSKEKPKRQIPER